MLADEFFLGTKLYHKKFAELCQPIAKYLGVTNAIYLNVDKNGRVFNIHTSSKWVERFLEEKYYKVDPFMVHPDNMNNGLAIGGDADPESTEIPLYYDAAVNFNLHHLFAHIEKTANGGYVGIGFGTTKDNYKITNRLINEAPIVKKGIRDLNAKLSLLIHKDLEENKMDFAGLKGDEFHSQKGIIFNEQDANKNKIELLQESGILSASDGELFLSDTSLSPQEINCLRIYHATHSIKQVARYLNLAVTTVTSYIENIKGKLNCNNKNSLFEKAEILESLGRI